MGRCPLCGGPAIVGHSLEACALWLGLVLRTGRLRLADPSR